MIHTNADATPLMISNLTEVQRRNLQQACRSSLTAVKVEVHRTATAYIALGVPELEYLLHRVMVR
jgi:hypothetical protein